jgi:hypothetical protein
VPDPSTRKALAEPVAPAASQPDESGHYEPNVQHSATSEETETDEGPGYAGLTEQQMLAMQALLTGQTLDEAAEESQTDLATLYQWLRGDYQFQAAMNRLAAERRQSIQHRLAQLSNRAAELVHHKIEHGHGRLAIKLLKGLGYLSGKPEVVHSEEVRELEEIEERGARLNACFA